MNYTAMLTYPIYLDLSDFVERYGGIVAASKELINYTEKLLQKRLESFAGELTMNDIFKGNKSEILRRISREAMGVPRTIGLILQNALTQAEVRNEKFIQLSDINVGIRETRKIYFKQFQGAVQKKVIPGFCIPLWIKTISLLNVCIRETPPAWTISKVRGTG